MPTKPKLPNEPKVFPAKVRGRGMRITLKFTPPPPAPRVMFTELPQLFTAIPQVFHQRPMSKDSYAKGFPVLVIPFPSRKAAESARKFWALTPEERVERLAEAIFNTSYGKENLPPSLRGLRKPLPTWEQLVTESPENAVVGNCRLKARACLAAMGGGTK